MESCYRSNHAEGVYRTFIEELRGKYEDVAQTAQTFQMLKPGQKIPDFAVFSRRISRPMVAEVLRWRSAVDITVSIPGRSFNDFIDAHYSQPICKSINPAFLRHYDQEPKDWCFNLIEATNNPWPLQDFDRSDSGLLVRINQAKSYNQIHGLLPMHRLPYFFFMLSSLRRNYPINATFLNGDPLLSAGNYPIAASSNSLRELLFDFYQPSMGFYPGFRRLIGDDVSKKF